MRPTLKFLAILTVVCTIGALLISAGHSPLTALAAPDVPDGPVRKKTITVQFTRYEWWVSYWDSNQVACQVFIEHEGLPTTDEVLTQCGPAVATDWLNTAPCAQAEGEPQTCIGVYLHLINSAPDSREIIVDLPLPEAYVSLTGCDPQPPNNLCDTAPFLHLEGAEPLPNEVIISIEGLFDGKPFNCPGSSCDLPLQPTGVKGASVQFWVNSSFGDTSDAYTALIRMVPWGDFMAPEGQKSDQPSWYVDVLSSQWRGAPVASCAQTWEAFPDLGGPPQWLTTPADASSLATDAPYYYLAGALIRQGLVDASSCADGGLQAPSVASQCGLEVAQPAVVEWQNRFDNEILQVANDTGVPAYLMKNIFSRESQFWPGFFNTIKEAGLGQLTDNGADTVLLWNPTFFTQFCPLVFDKSRCDLGFGNLNPDEQATLRGALVTKVNSSCVDCTTGIDLSQANMSINVFAQTLLANCEQAGRVVRYAAKVAPGQVSSYVDMWLFTLINYNAGPGCLTNAVQRTISEGKEVNFANVASRLEDACRGSLGYIQDITGLDTSAIVFEPTLVPTATQPGSGSPTPTQPGNLPTSTPEPTQSGYPPPVPTWTPVPYP